MKMPNLIYLKHELKREKMRCFKGIGREEEANTTRVLFQFFYNVSIGNAEEAIKTIKLIHDPNLWESMAKVSIKSNKLEIAKICLSNMYHIRGSK